MIAEMAKTTRIGLVADTHMPPNDPKVIALMEEAFAGVDLILHAGDIVTLSVLDWLDTIAPVYAAIGNNDTMLPPDRRLKKYQGLEVDGVSIGMFHIYEPYDWEPSRFLKKYFGIDVLPDVIVVGDTHFEIVEEREGVLIINPGSPTSSHLRVDLPGTVGILTIEDGVPSAEILYLGVD